MRYSDLSPESKAIVRERVAESGYEVISHGGRFSWARWSQANAQWSAPMHREARRMTGCHTVAARFPAGIVLDGCVSVYRTRDSALAALRDHFAKLEFGD